MNDLYPLTLPSLDGSTPLGFLASLGTWRVAEQIQPGTKLLWKSCAGHWAPVLHFRKVMNEPNFVGQLFDKLKEGSSNQMFLLNKDLKIPVKSFQKKAIESIKNGDLKLAEWLSAVGSDAHKDRYGNIEGTLFDLMNAGKQYFLQTICFLVNNISEDDLRNTLFEKWAYRNQRGGMRWDLAEDRRYALRWKDPQADTTESQWGANRLAIEALPMLQTIPTFKRLETSGFVSKGKKQTFFTWPIWRYPITIDTCRSLLGLAGNYRASDSCDFTRIGIINLFRSQRIWKGKPPHDYSNFCPSVVIA